jgi:uncharacterized protein (DUF362 family)
MITQKRLWDYDELDEVRITGMIKTLKPALVPFTTYAEAIGRALDAIGAKAVLGRQTAILIKPNLVTAERHPVTTHPDCCAAIIEYIRACSAAEIVIAEGCGDAHMETDEIFAALGYDRLAARYGIPLVDLNHAPTVCRVRSDCPIFPEMVLPEIAFTHFILSVPVLKAHCLADITGTLKNMMGFAPPAHYAGRGGIWKKAVFHENMQQSIVDLNRYRTPDLTLLDACTGLARYHLGGPCCDPPVSRIVAGFDPLAVDREAARLLGLDWRAIGHLLGGRGQQRV